ncbi:MAG: CDP-diacylglycerol--glycerol-3-phosphate 3-phosphatidyltransferase [Candidatus Omnitrophica bacterium]|nr:CDP-diacylglycerol--glycerol-3-phosphate 3-phosphatidyltransferase [Candidatus Omnitrophota bacterium]
MNLPNSITVIRIILVPVFVLFILYHKLEISFAIFIAAAFTDALDGYLARTLKQKTKLGAFLDPIADKLLVGSAYFCFSLVNDLPQYVRMPIYVPLVVISRDVLILIGFMIINLLKGEIEVRPTILGKLTTFFQMLTIGALLTRYVHSNIIWNTMVALTIISGLDYLRIGAKKVNING